MEKKMQQSITRDGSGVQANQNPQHQQQDKNKVKKERTKSDARRLLLEEVDKAKKLLIEGKTEESNDVAFKALILYKDDLGGESSILTLPGYFILAEANIQDHKLKKAEEYLIAAYWNFLKYTKEDDQAEDGEQGDEGKKDKEEITEDEKLSYKGTLHKTFSKLFLAQKEYQKALDELKNGILMDSVKYGPENIITSLNYYQMGNIFLQMKDTAKGEAFYGKTSEIWYRYFKKYQRSLEQYQEGQEPIEAPEEMIVTEAFDILHVILIYFEEKYQEEERRLVHLPLLNTYRAMAFVLKHIDQEDKYREYIHHAYYECLQWKGEEHRKTQQLKEMCEMAGEIQEPQQQRQQDHNQYDYDQQESLRQQQYAEQEQEQEQYQKPSSRQQSQKSHQSNQQKSKNQQPQDEDLKAQEQQEIEDLQRQIQEQQQQLESEQQILENDQQIANEGGDANYDNSPEQQNEVEGDGDGDGQIQDQGQEEGQEEGGEEEEPQIQNE